MNTLREIIGNAEKVGVAIGHFNISNTEALWGIVSAAKKLNVPVIIGTSEGERNFIGVKQAVALVQSIREELDHPIFLNADHTYSFEKVKEAVDAGYDAVIFDGAQLSLEENIKITKQCVEYARKREALRQAQGDHNACIVVEGEIGFIGTSSKLLDDIPKGASVAKDTLTKPEELRQFVEETGVDLVAPAVGNLHGMLKGGKNPALDIGRIKELREAAGVPLVLHGGSGITDDDFKKAIQAGVSIIHINTEIRVAYKKALQLSLQESEDEVAPYKLLKPVRDAVEKVVEQKLKLFNNL